MVGEKAIKGDFDLIHSKRDFDWLGPGAYFWESDPKRALEWAQWKFERGEINEPYVVGAVIDLRNCLDLVARENLELLHDAYVSFKALQEKAALPLPVNKTVPGSPDDDRILRYLDCAVIKHLHSILELESAEIRLVDPFDTVRGMFAEGEEVYPGCGFKNRNHVQIAVMNSDCIKGIFIPRPFPDF